MLFTLGPGLVTLGPRWLVTAAILVSGVVCVLALVLDPTFRRRELADAGAARRGIGRVLLRTLIVWLFLLGVTAIATPDTLFAFPRARPGLWLMAMVLYPLSAYAQEIVFRTFFFHRYGDLFVRPRTLVLASGLVFGWAHIVVNNLVAVPLAAVAGVLFASTYQRSRSTLLVTVEHALYGNFVFSVGLGSLFYSPARWL